MLLSTWQYCLVCPPLLVLKGWVLTSSWLDAGHWGRLWHLANLSRMTWTRWWYTPSPGQSAWCWGRPCWCRSSDHPWHTPLLPPPPAATSLLELESPKQRQFRITHAALASKSWRFFYALEASDFRIIFSTWINASYSGCLYVVMILHSENDQLKQYFKCEYVNNNHH